MIVERTTHVSALAVWSHDAPSKAADPRDRKEAGATRFAEG